MTTLTILGSGDAFGSGGRGQTAMLLEVREGGGTYRALIDCGATALPALRRRGLHADDLDAVLLTHFHGDHFAGLPFVLLEGAFGRPRTRPLPVAGPPGVGGFVERLFEASYPGNTVAELPFTVPFVQPFDAAGASLELALGPLSARWHPVDHAEAARPHGIRVATPHGVVAYSGDTAWTEALIPLAQGADLLVIECHGFRTPVPGHLTHRDLVRHGDARRAKRIVCTHLGEEALAHRADFAFEVAEDGMELRIGA
jgi:ribonuclease BN (tRNA processing enzyme)